MDVRLPDGTVVTNVPEGTTQTELLDRLKAGGYDVSWAFPPTKESSIFGEAKRGAKQLVSGARTGVGAAFGSPEEAARAGVERAQKIEEEAGEGPSFERVKRVYEERGLLPAAGQVLSDIPRLVAQQAPQIGVTLGGAKAGAALGTAIAGPPGALIGGGLGAVAANVPSLFGQAVERQAAEQAKQGQPIDISTGRAAVSTAGSAALEAAGAAGVLGKTLVKRVLGVADDAALAASRSKEELVRAAQATIAGGAARGAAVEMPTEVAQSVLDRWQAGLDVTGDDALKEYGESLYAAGIVGGTLGGVSTVPSRRQAQQALEEPLAPGQRPGESLEQTATRLNAEIQALQVPPSPYLSGQQLADIASGESGFGKLVQYEEQIKQQPVSAERDEALAIARDLRRRMEIEEIERQKPRESFVLKTSDLVKAGIPKTDPLFEELKGKDLNIPDEATQVVTLVEEAQKRPDITPELYDRLEGLLTSVDAYLKDVPGSGFYAQRAYPQPSGTSVSVAGEPGAVPTGGVEPSGRKRVAGAPETVVQPVPREEAAPAPVDEYYRAGPRAAFGKAIGAVAGSELRARRDNPNLLASAKAENIGGVMNALSRSKSPIVAEVGRRGVPEGVSVKIDDNAIEEYIGKSRSDDRFVIAMAKNLLALRDAIKNKTTFLETTPIDDEGNEKTFVTNPEGLNILQAEPYWLMNLKPQGVKQLTPAQLEKAVDDEIARHGEDRLKLVATASAIKTGVPGGTYDPLTKTIKLAEYFAKQEGVVAHEVVHAQVVEAVANPTDKQKPHVERLKALYEHVKDVAKKRDLEFYGISSIQEFIAEGMSNPRFQFFLNSLPYEKQTAWSKFVQTIADLLGVKNNTAFLELLSVYDRIAPALPVKQEQVAPPVPAVEPAYEPGLEIGLSERVQELEAELKKIEAERRQVVKLNPGPNLFTAVKGKLARSDVLDIGTDRHFRLLTNAQGRGTFVSELVNNSQLDAWLPPDKRPDSSSYDAKESEEYIKDLLRNRDHIPDAVKERLKKLDLQISNVDEAIETEKQLETLIRQANAEFQVAAEERRAEEAELPSTEGEAGGVKRAEEPAGRKSLREVAPQVSEEKFRELERKAKEPAKPAKPAEPTEEEKTKADKIEQLRGILKRILAKYNLKDVELDLEEGMKDEGSFSGRLIKLALDNLDPVRVLRHESVHALKELGFFTPAQWKVLTDRANKEWIDKFLKQRNVDGLPLEEGQQSRYDAYMDLYKGDKEAVMEEAISDAFAYFSEEKPTGLMQALVKRVQNLFKALKEALNLSGFETAEDVFGKIEKGKLQPTITEGKPSEKASLRTQTGTVSFKKWSRNAPLVAAKDALDYNFETGKPFVAQTYHGTNADEDFVEFDIERGGAQTAAESASMGIFSTSEPEVAGGYAGNIGFGRVLGASLGTNEMSKVVEEARQTPKVIEAIRQLDAARKTLHDAQTALITLTRDKLTSRLDEEKTGLFKKLSDSAVINASEVFADRYPDIAKAREKVDESVNAYDKADRKAGQLVMERVAESLPQRIMPLYVRMANPMVYDAEGKTPGDFPLSERIAEAKRAGHDGVVFKNIADPAPVAVHYVTFKPEDIKSAIGNVGTFDETSPDIRKSLRTAEFKFWFGNSKITEDGQPKVMYHGTGKAYEALGTARRQARAIFVTDDPEFAEKFAKDTFARAAAEAAQGKVSPEVYKRGVDLAISNVRKDYKNRPEGRAMIADIKKGYDEASAEAQEYMRNAFKEVLPAGPNIIPVYVKAENPFDYENKDLIKQISPLVAENLKVAEGSTEHLKTMREIEKGNWETIEDPAVQKTLTTLGFDGFYVKEQGRKSLAVYSPSQLKSVFNTAPTERPELSLSLRSLSNAKTANVMATVNKIAPPSYDPTLWEKILGVFKGEAYTKIRSQIINRYEALAALDKRVAKMLEQTGGAAQLADSKAESAALFSDLGGGLLAAAFGANDRIGGAPVYRNGMTVIDNQNGAIKGPLLIFKPLMDLKDPDVFRIWQTYAAVKRGSRLLPEGREKLVDQPDIQAMQDLAQRDPNLVKLFESVRQDWLKYNNALVKYMQDTGVITPEMAKVWTQNGDYFPFYRLMQEDVQGPKMFRALGNVAPPKKLKGGESPLGDFFENIVMNSQAAIQAGIKNIAAQRATKQALLIGEAQKLPKKETWPNVYRVMENGKEVYYESSDPLFIDAIKALNVADLPFIGLLSGPANILRNLVTKDPAFMLANMMRDSLSAYVTSGVKMTPILDTVKNFAKAIANKSPETRDLYAAGILGGYDYSRGSQVSAKEFEKRLREVSKAKTSFEVATTPFTSVWNALEKGTQASDAATRAEVYKRVLAETGNEAEAYFQALEIMNFNRRGNSAVVRVLTAAVPFLNARMQGLDLLFRTAIYPLTGSDTSVAKQRMKTFWTRGMTLMALSSMYWLLTHDDEEYLAQEQETRDNYWLIPSLGVKIPIPFEVGVVFKVIPERIMNLTFGQDTNKDFTESMKRQFQSTFMFNMIPQLFLPYYEVATNHSFFTQRPIIGKGLEDVAGPYQIGPSTSKVAEAIGKSVGYSPIKVDHLIKGYTGTMGMYAVDVFDMMFAEKASKRFEQMPVVKRFALDPEARGSVTAYYGLKDSVDEVVRTANLLDRSMNYKEYGEYMKENLKMFSARDYISSLEKDMKELRDMKRFVMSSQMDGDQKRDSITSIGRLEKKLTQNIQTLKKQVQ